MVLDPTSRKELVFLAQLAEQAERYEEMVKYVKRLAEEGTVLTLEERNLLSLAYKNVVGFRRASWRRVVNAEKNADLDSARLKMATELRSTIESEISQYCYEVIHVLDTVLIPLELAGLDTENKVFYLKMKGDYLRYLAEVSKGDERSKHAELSKIAYEASEKEALQLPATNHIRLGLALNFSTYWYDIGDSRENACTLARKAFDDAIPELCNVDEISACKETTLILQLLRDNLMCWMTEELEERGRGQPGQVLGFDYGEGINEAQQGQI